MTAKTMYDFDQQLDHRGSNSIKWEYTVRNQVIRYWDGTSPEHGEERVLPMWVADMDFAVAPEIAAAIQERAAHPVYGYANVPPGYRELVAAWQRQRNGWDVNPEWVLPVPGIVPAMHLFVRRFTQPGDGVLIQRPVYHPFSFAAVNNGREVVNSSLRLVDGVYSMDFDDLERKASDPRVKVALLCSPHNPVGRVWTAEELSQYAEICARNDVLVFADEIHGDLIMPGIDFVPYASLDAAHQGPFMVGTATSKSFNLAGLKTANLVISDTHLHAEMAAEVRSCGLLGMNPFGVAATMAAYEHGEPWLDAAVSYIAENFAYVDDYLKQQLPEVSMIDAQGTYLCWLDFSALGLDTQELADLLLKKARLYLDEGQIFGSEGEGFARVNVACPRSVLVEAMQRLRRAIRE